MNGTIRCVGVGLMGLAAGLSLLPLPPARATAAQPAPAAEPTVAPAPAPKPALAPAPAAEPLPAGPYRQLAPWVMTSINPMRQLQETVSRHDVVELLAVNPNLDWAKDVPFRREIWALQFQFKPLRFIWVDIPQPTGRMQRKLIRYLVYSVTNPGMVARPEEQVDGTYKIVPVDKAVRFVPEFTLESLDPGDDRVYPDRVIPAAMARIRMREDPHRTFYNTVEMVREIAVGETVWGAATWEDVDPRIDRFAINVTGLTNAYDWVDEEGRYKPGDRIGTGRKLIGKTLRLYFWRPGDEYDEDESEIRFGIPGQVDYEWITPYKKAFMD